jgi:hypothetical protein
MEGIPLNAFKNIYTTVKEDSQRHKRRGSHRPIYAVSNKIDRVHGGRELVFFGGDRISDVYPEGVL